MDEWRLHVIPLFAGLSRRQRKAVALRADEVEVDAGAVLCREGDWPHEFFAIEEGSARVVRGEQYLDELGPGDFFGETGLVRHAPRNASVIAQRPLRAVVLTESAFNQIDREMPEVARRIRAAIDERARWLEPVIG